MSTNKCFIVALIALFLLLPLALGDEIVADIPEAFEEPAETTAEASELPVLEPVVSPVEETTACSGNECIIIPIIIPGETTSTPIPTVPAPIAETIIVPTGCHSFLSPDKCLADSACAWNAETGTCGGEEIEQMVTCIFKGSEKEERCYSADGKFSCQGLNSCQVLITGWKRDEVLWKSTCGGYASTIFDGSSSQASFYCLSGEISEDQLEKRGFMNAYWRCYDGVDEKTFPTSCLLSEEWQAQAREFCTGHCYADGSKCGVNHFSVSGECYPERLIDLPVEEPVLPVEEPVSVPEVNEPIPIEKIPSEELEEILICKDSCPFDGKCYPFGYRKNGNYCSDSGSFELQLSSENSCENNFQCESNFCISDQCVSESFLEQVLNWFKKLFS